MRWQLLATGSDGGMVNTGGSTGAAGGSGGDAGQPAVFEDNGALSFARVGVVTVSLNRLDGQISPELLDEAVP